MMEDKQIGVPTNVAVFIDYENVYKALLEEKTNVLRLAFFEKLRKWCSEHQRRVVRIVVYCNFDNMDLHESFHQSVLQSYGVETVHTSNQGKNYADLKITIDVLSSMYSNNNIDEFFIMSNDKDMTPLLNTIRANKRNVAVITTGSTYNPSICEFADSHIELEEICDVEVTHKIIDDIANAYWNKLESYINAQISNFGVTGKYAARFAGAIADNAVDHAAGLCAARRVGKQPVLPAHHKRLDAALGTVVAQLQTAILQIPVRYGHCSSR